MTRDVLDDAPAALSRRIRTASVPAFLRALCLHLPATLVVDATLSTDADRVPDTACSWIKLARTGGTRAQIGSLTFVGDARPTSLHIRARERVCVLEGDHLAGDFASSIERVFAALFESTDHVATLRAFAFQSSMLETLHTITHNMLATRDVPRALHVMLSGITSGYGLGFHRAALFVHDPAENVFRGFRAIGPADRDDAHRIWEELELEDRPIEDLIGAGRGGGETPFEQRVRDLVLRASDADGDEISRAIDTRGPQRFGRTAAVNPSLATLVQGTEFVLAAIRPRDRLLGLVYADNAFGGAAIPDEIEHLLGFFVDQTAVVWEHLSLLEHVDRLARFDALTGLPNRRQFEARIAAGASDPVALILIDVDRFKNFNDTAGHAAGDAVLRSVADVLRACLPADAMPARIGGDEFAVLLPDTDLAQARALMHAIGFASAERGVSLSLGAARVPDHAATLASVVTVADTQLYRAKEAGRGRSAMPGETPEPPHG